MLFSKKWLKNDPQFLLHFLIHIDVLMLQYSAQKKLSSAQYYRGSAVDTLTVVTSHCGGLVPYVCGLNAVSYGEYRSIIHVLRWVWPCSFASYMYVAR